MACDVIYPREFPAGCAMTVLDLFRGNIEEDRLQEAVNAAYNFTGFLLRETVGIPRAEMGAEMGESSHYIPSHEETDLLKEIVEASKEYSEEMRAIPWSDILPMLVSMIQVLLAEWLKK